jgi:NOL1/NOP2/fmu family ribosome biogenesis protein
MFGRDAGAIKAYTANKPEACATVQREILHHAANMLKNGGRLVYSTCTFNTEENEGTITAFLEKHPNFSLLKTERIWPHKARGEGHFVALLEKSGENSPQKGKNTTPKNSKEFKEPQEFKEFREEFLDYSFPKGAFILHGVNLYFQQVPLDLRGIRVARSGWHLGECVKGRFVPSQALAMGLRKEQARYPVELPESDAFRYLRGESLYLESPQSDPVDDLVKSCKPWVLVCHNGFPLGWARLVQGRLKNNLPVGWAIK